MVECHEVTCNFVVPLCVWNGGGLDIGLFDLLLRARRLMTELDAYHPKDSAKEGQVAPKAGADANHITYQLYYRPEQAKFANNARVRIAPLSRFC